MIKPWKVVARKEVFKKYSRKIEQVNFVMPDGSTADFYLKVEGPVVAVLALTTEQKVVLTRQFRPGPNKVLLEMPGGVVDPGEDPINAAGRELLEETGYKGNLKEVSTCLDDAYSTMIRHVIVATDCVKIANQQNTSTEYTEVDEVSISEFRNILRTGQMTDVEVGYLALDYLNKL